MVQEWSNDEVDLEQIRQKHAEMWKRSKSKQVELKREETLVLGPPAEIKPILS